MNIEQIIKFCEPLKISGDKPAKMGKLCQDSREVVEGDIFIAVKGYKSDGHNFIQEAVERGASVVIAEKEITGVDGVMILQVKNTRKLLGPLAQFIAGNPAQKLTIIGVTGTNGKTTVCTLIWQALTKLGYKASLLGTVEKRVNQEEFKSRLTTADPIELSYDMRQMVEAGSEYLVMEVSSHALSQERVRGIPFKVAVFTNLSHDHLDYHKSMNEYASAKKKLFSSLDDKSWAVTNLDDSRGEWITNTTPAKILSFSFKAKGLFKAELISAGVEGSVIMLDDIKIKTPLVGLFNAYNVIEALLACTALGLDGRHLSEILSVCNGAPGRMERVNLASKTVKEPLVFVDYAHTPNALENVASTLNHLKSPNQKLVIIFGCGGDRDKTKRPVMAEIAEEIADKVIVTSDNPRTEDPDSIIDDIMRGFKNRKPVTRITSRQNAITKTILEADINSIVLIAGKGHETYQEINGVRTHFDDREVALDALKEWKLQNKERVG
ncbi:MAG: UDP-N-acetylmuramoyl-L-alanyl-D-glutamate--2,6-diaminopimelate ligase [Balneolaceae bacterium]|nr:MAG: UDP-N-acetylmuramoyl-L-alanyl-D-glutamate--2,6-diaminopimelate ligase [Balneolaceae bacterium]